MQIVNQSAASLSRLMAQGRLSPVDVVDAFLSRIARWDGKLHAFTEVYEAEARLAAEAAHKAIRQGDALGPLHGMPIALKDLVEIEGKVVSAGCTAWSRKSDRTAAVARNLAAQGLIVLGKTHLVQFAIGGWGTNSDMGNPWNPWDLDVALTPGGSSSGSGVAVAGGLVPWAVGTDTGGSIRIPASWCGLTGLKVSDGIIDKSGVVPLSKTLDTVGPLARDAVDAGILYRAMAGHPAGREVSDREENSGISGVRLAFIPDAERAYVEPAVLAAYDASLERLASLGAELVPLELPWKLADLAQVSGAIMCSEAYAQFGPLVDDENIPLDPYSRAFVLKGRQISDQEYRLALARRKELQAGFRACLAGCDALLTPTTRTGPLPLEGLDQTQTPSHFTRFANILDLCAVAIPNGSTASGLPTSLQVASLPGREETILRVARAYQAATDWHRRGPGVRELA